jgi:anti-sigma B factor antagonist
MSRTTVKDADPNFGEDQPFGHHRAAVSGHPNDMLRVDVSTAADGTRTLQLAGEIDLVTVAMLQSRVMAELTQSRPQLVLDMRKVGFLGSCGLAALVEIRTEAIRRNVGLRLVSDSRAVLRPLAVTGLMELFDVSSEPDGG